MTDSDEALIPHGSTSMTPTPAAHEAAGRIRALHMTARTFAQLIEAQIMESLWIIRRELPVDAEFYTFVESQTPIDRRRARLMVDTWSVARRRRELRELAQSRPSEALALMKSAIDAGVQLADATDKQVAELLSRPPRQRNRAIRELIESHEAQEEESTVREPERPIVGTVGRNEESRSSRLGELLEALQKIEGELADLLLTAEMVLGETRPIPGAGRERLLSLAAIATDHIERINDLALSSRQNAPTGSSR
jgi:hypothetical protein